MNQVCEWITTAEDGDTTVNERLSSGGPGPEGQPDTVVERLSGQQAEPVAPVEDPVEDDKPKRSRKS